MEFNTHQKEVINFGKGTLLVEAGPGSGKTTVIVSRIKELIKKGLDPESFLVITFTRKAADNLKFKLKQDLDKSQVDKMQISSIHSFCLDFLKSKNQVLNLLDDDTSEKKALFIQKFKEELGFKDESTLLNYQIPAVMDKFSEYTSFNVNTNDLLAEIKKAHPVSQEYLNFISSLSFFSKKRIDDNGFKDEWYNARFLEVIKAYPKYLELLDKYSYVDYDTLQLKTLKELEKDPKTQFNVIFVDEFQDTDPLQFRIFKILNENCDYFTAVGDVDQHIYAFRSSFSDYFDEMSKLPNTQIISLDVNYRSTKNIVEVTDAFISPQRKQYSQKHLRSANDEYDNDTFIIENESYDVEANNIFKLIKTLIETKNIKDEDIAVLYRTHNNKTLPELINLFEEHNINYSIRGQSDLADKDDVKSVILLLWYITRKTNLGHIPSRDELNELNLKAFCGDYFNPVFFSLEDETKLYLQNLQDSYYDEILRIENEVRKNHGKRKIKSFKRVRDNEDQDSLFEIFNQIQQPIINLEEIKSTKDKEFFEKLESLREESTQEDSRTILEIYYDLISMGNFIKTNDMSNLALLTQTIYNYESFMSNTDVKGLFYFLNGVIGNYSSSQVDDSGIQLMTVHAAKGLEFPVTIVMSLEKDRFPMKIKDPQREKNTIFMKDTFYTPNEFLEYKNITLEEENQLDIEEEERIIYVAMTRAADLLVLSCVGEIPSQIEHIKPLLNGELNLDNVTIKKQFPQDSEEKLKLNYSSYSTYNLCPFMYNLIYNLGFRVSDENVTNLGTVFHEVMEIVNLKLKGHEKVSKDELKEITREVYTSMFDINETKDKFDELQDSVLNYYDSYSLNHDVLETELPFEIERDNYTLNGAIDLIYKVSPSEIEILDYKNAEHDDYKIAHYEKQLYIYASALAEIPEFNNYNIKKAITHFVKTDYKHEVEITEEKINNQLNKLNKVALKIKNEEYPKRESNFCKYCKFRIIC